MEIINILIIYNGIPERIASFPIKEGLSNKVLSVDEAEKCFIAYIKDYEPYLTKEDEKLYIEQGSYDDKNGHEVYIMWSN